MIGSFKPQTVEGQPPADYARSALQYMIAPKADAPENPHETKTKEKCVFVREYNISPYCGTKTALNSTKAARQAANRMAEEFTNVAAMRDSIEKPFCHWVYSLSPEESKKYRNHVGYEKLCDFAALHLERLGFDREKNQIGMFVHADKKHLHVHVFANRVGPDGSLVRMGIEGSGWYENDNLQALVEVSHKLGFEQVPEIAEKFDLSELDTTGIAYPVDAAGNRTKHLKSHNSLQKISRTAQELEKRKALEFEKETGRPASECPFKSDERQLKEALSAALPDLKPGMGWLQTKNDLAERGIEIRWNSGLTFRLNEGKPFAASKLGVEVSLSRMKDILTLPPDPTRYASDKDSLKTALAQVNGMLHGGCGWPFYHQRLAEFGILADRRTIGKGRQSQKEIIFSSLADGQKFSEKELGEEFGIDAIQKVIGRGWRTRPDEVSVPALAAKSQAENVAKAQGQGKAQTDGQDDTQTTAQVQAKTQENKAVADKQITVRLEAEIRILMVSYRKIRAGIIKRQTRNPAEERKILAASKAAGITPPAKNGFDTPEEAVMSVLAIIMNLLFAGGGQTLPTKALTPASVSASTSAHAPAPASASAIPSANYLIGEMTVLRRWSRQKGIILPVDIFELHKNAALRASKLTAETADPGKLARMIAVRLRITDKTPDEVQSILMIGGMPPETAQKATRYAFGRNDTGYHELKKKYHNKIKMMEQSHAKFTPSHDEQDHSKISAKGHKQKQPDGHTADIGHERRA